MKSSDIKEYLEKELPEFQYIAGDTTPYEENWNSIRIMRDGKELVLDVSKVDNKKGLVNLKAYVSDLWKRANR